MEKVRAKFKCESILDNGYNKQAVLNAVYSEKGENADFNKATPNGKLSITIDKEVPASDFFVPNQEYYLDFTVAPKP